jgi:hypothetical protein
VLWAFIAGRICPLSQLLDIADDLFLDLPTPSNLLSITVRNDPFATLWTEEVESSIGTACPALLRMKLCPARRVS